MHARLAFMALFLAGCGGADDAIPTLRWYVADEGSGAFQVAAQRCAQASNGAYRIEIAPLPADADQQREQLVRRPAARGRDNDIIGMDGLLAAGIAPAGG